jgi:hypothetical protein
MKLPQHLLSLLVAKFGAYIHSPPRTRDWFVFCLTHVVWIASSPSGSEVGKHTITFDRFMRACVFVKQFTEAFAKLDTDKDGWVQLTYEQLLMFYLSLP